MVIGPGELEHAWARHTHLERNVGVGRDARAEFGAKHLLVPNFATNVLMMSRGIGLPFLSLRLPVSMTCVINVFTSITSPILTCSGSLMRGLAAMTPKFSS